MGATYFAGPYRFENAMIYVNRGLGSASWPWRIRATPEITFFTLHHNNTPQLELEHTHTISVEHRPESIESTHHVS